MKRDLPSFPEKLLGVKPLYGQKNDDEKGRPNFKGVSTSAVRETCNRPPLIRETSHPLYIQEPRKKIRLSKSLSYNYTSDVKMIGATMYEPVSDIRLSGVGRAGVDVPSRRRISNCLIDANTGQEHQVRSSTTYPEPTLDQEPGLVPPVKPPRKKKYQQMARHHSYDSSYIKMKIGHGDTSCVDIDHITFENNCRNKYVDGSVQTSQLIPYRLRFWPRSSCDLKYDPKKESCTVVGLQCGCKVITQWILSQMGLTMVVFGWALLGAYAFYKTEGPREFAQQNNMDLTQHDLSIELATVLRQTDIHQEEWPKQIEKYMQKHEDLLLKAVGEGFGEGGEGNIWTYPGCILFAVSLLTTLGFGAPVPRTSLGRGTAVIFSAIGIPLHFLLIFNMGNLGAIRLQQLAYKISSTDIPIGTPPPKWLKWFPVCAILVYYLMGVVLFGFLRTRAAFESFLFPLDFTAAGGVASVQGYIKICYAVYLEIAVTLAALVVSLLQASATRSLVDVGLKLGLLTNT